MYQTSFEFRLTYRFQPNIGTKSIADMSQQINV
uniref:Uncharacterized protein n=1 Tax=Arundo donax TaxID=35708 RepID=A0A0A9BS41_ARUDO